MKEKIAIILDDLDNHEKTVNQLVLLFEKIIEYYAKTNFEYTINFVQALSEYFDVFYQEFKKEIK
jgi:hypothetical protein